MAKNPNGKKHESYQFMPVKAVVISMGIVLAITALSFVAMLAYFHSLEQAKIYLSEEPSPMLANQKPYDGPLIQADVTAELSQVSAEVNKVLSEYGWVDKDAGVVHIPIDKAMDKAIQRGYPVRKDVMAQ